MGPGKGATAGASEWTTMTRDATKIVIIVKCAVTLRRFGAESAHHG
jgi:hypothetical protein